MAPGNTKSCIPKVPPTWQKLNKESIVNGQCPHGQGKPLQASTPHTELCATEEIWDEEKWPSSEKNTPTGYSVPMVSLENIHTSNIIWTK